MSATLVVARGARRVEEQLLSDIGTALADRSRREPVLVVVPSGGLRAHLASLIVARFGPAVLGIRIQTHANLARDVLERACHAAVPSDALHEVLLRRAAAAEPALAPLLEMAGGPEIVSASVRDLLSAGLEADRGQQAERSLPADADRPRAIVRTALRVAQEAARLGVQRGSDRLAVAAGLLEEGGGTPLGAGAVFVHGYAGATGRVTRFLRAIAAAGPARIYLDEPPDPAQPGPADRGAVFVRDFARRLAATSTQRAALEPAPATIRMFHAVGAEAEVREAASRIRALLDAGVAPERIGVVARSIDAYTVSIRGIFESLGIPFSGGNGVSAPEGLDPAARRRLSVLALIAGKDASSLDAWLDACVALRTADAAVATAAHADLRLGLRALGLVRVRDLAALDLGSVLGTRRALPLPVRGGLDEEADAHRGARRRMLGRATLDGAVTRARQLAAHLAAWPREARVTAHVAHAERLLVDVLGWDPRSAPFKPWRAAFRDLLEQDRPDLLLDAREGAGIIAGAVSGAELPLGGAGGGVQVNSVGGARALTWDHLFVLGLNRGVFPQAPHADALLPDATRRRLARWIPELGTKDNAVEERFLFAQLLAAAPEVTLSWQRAGADGAERNRSVFVEELLLARGSGSPPEPPLGVPRLALARLAGLAPRTAREQFRLAALRGPRDAAFGFFAPALAEARDRFEPADPAAAATSSGDAAALSSGGAGAAPGSATGDADLAAARLAVLDEHDPDRGEGGAPPAPRPGAYMGLLLPGTGVRDPLFVTTLEAYARCPWQAMLLRILRLEQPPDPAAAYPEIDALLIGNTVHRALQQLFALPLGDRPRDLAELASVAPVDVGAPARDDIERAVQGAAATSARDEGLFLPGLIRVLARRALPFVERAVELDWQAPGAMVRISGLEVNGTCAIEMDGAPRTLAFRADRVDVAPQGGFILTDYKSGKPFCDAAGEDTRLGHLRDKVAAAERLQAAAYASAGRAGRYLYLHPEVDPARAVFVLEADDIVVTKTFPETVRLLLAAWDGGIFIPRLELPNGKEPDACENCETRLACPAGDTGAARRLRALARVPGDAARLAGLWLLPEARRPEVPGDGP